MNPEPVTNKVNDCPVGKTTAGDKDEIVNTPAGVMVNGSVPEVAPFDVTEIEAVPADAMSSAGTMPNNAVGPWFPVSTGLPFQFTTASLPKFEPVTDRKNSPLPACAKFGDKETITGVGPLLPEPATQVISMSAITACNFVRIITLCGSYRQHAMSTYSGLSSKPFSAMSACNTSALCPWTSKICRTRWHTVS